MTLVLLLHVVAVVFLIGPVTVATSASARAVRSGTAGLPLLRWLHRTTRICGAASILVFGLGLGLVPLQNRSYGAPWIGASMTLYLVGLGLTLGLIARDQQAAIRELEATGNAGSLPGRLAAVSGVVALIWLAILVLMFYQPGG